VAVSILLLILGLLVLVAGAEFLVRGGAALALRFHIRPLVIGLTVVAFGTSAPELAVSIKASLAGQGDVAAGNVIGSNIFNVAAILGFSALIFPLRVDIRLIRFDIPLMILVSMVGMFLMMDRMISRVEGSMLVLGLFAYTILTFRFAGRESPEANAEAASELPARNRTILIDIGMVAAGLVGLVAGADWFVRGSINIARYLNISEAVIGLTIVAAGTSLPELATSVVAAFRRHTDIAVGNIVGSNIFNILAILGLTGLIHPFSTHNILLVDAVSMLLFSLILFPLAFTGFILKRWEGGLLLSGYVAYIIYRLFID